jgi:hypothetical protein
MTTVRVVQLITDVDMRMSKGLVTGRFHVISKLGRGQIALLLNRSCTIARFVDCEKTIHTMYALDGEAFDLDTIEAMVQKRTLAIGVSVVRNSNVKPKRVVGISAKRVEVTAKRRRAGNAG